MPDAVENAIAARPYLSEEQVSLVRSLTRSGDGVEVVRATAGTGKTTALEAAQEGWSASGYHVVGSTLVGARGGGDACRRRDLPCWDDRAPTDGSRPGWGVTEKSVVVIDEAGMVGTRDLEPARQRADAVALAEVVGDGRLERTGARLQEPTVIERELAERRERAYREAIVRAAHDPSQEVERELGPRPESLAEQERWDRADSHSSATACATRSYPAASRRANRCGGPRGSG